MKNIDSIYNETCKRYFSHWKPWPFTYDEKWYGHGHCDTDRKHIYLGPPKDRIKLLIIHEICHAVGNPHHGKGWQNRMLKAAVVASKYDKKLADDFRVNIRRYQDSLVSGREEMRMLFQNIGDAFMEQYLHNSTGGC